MAARFSRPETPQRLPAPRPLRRRLRDEQAIPRAPDVFAWAPGEMLIGEPRADRKASPLEDNPRKSNRAIAAEVGVSHETVRKLRPPADNNLSPAKIVGRDGKSYPSHGCRSEIRGQTVSQQADDHQ
jgi:hypothetical protein